MQVNKIYSILFSTLNLVFLTILASCQSDVQKVSCSSQEDYHPVYRQCVPKSLSGSISIKSYSPISANYTIPISSTVPIEHSVQVLDPYGQKYHTDWVLSGINSPGITVKTDSDQYSFIPNAHAAGVYVLEAIVKNKDRVHILSKASWAITVSPLAIPTILKPSNPPSPSVPSINLLTTGGSTSFKVSAHNPDLQTGYSLSYVLNATSSPQTTSLPPVPLYEYSYSFNPGESGLPLGNNVLQAFLKNSLGHTIETYTWTINLTHPSYPKISAIEVPESTTITVIDGLTLASDGFFRQDTGTPVRFCVQTNDFDGTANQDPLPGTELRFYTQNPGSGAKLPIAPPQDLSANHTDYCLRSFAGGYRHNLANPQVGEHKVLLVELWDKNTNQKTDSRSWTLSIRPKNTPPHIAVVSPSHNAPVEFVQDTEQTFIIKVSDQDSTSLSDFTPSFILTPNSTSASCTPLAPLTPDQFSCKITVPSWDSNGPIKVPSTSFKPYLLKTYVYDTPVPAWGGISLQSNMESWNLRVKEAQTAPYDLNFCITKLHSPSGGISTGACPSVTLEEGDSIYFHINVKDRERDHLRYSIKRCVGGASTDSCVNLPPDFINQDVDKLNGDLVTNITSKVYKIPENTVVGANEKDIFYKVSIQDRPDTVPSLNIERRKSWSIKNFNPPPVLVGPSSPDADASLSTPLKVFTGFPISLDPGVITDQSETDGDILQFQWQIAPVPSSGSPVFTDIPGGSTKTFTWTPPAYIGGKERFIRICIGDNGTGNAVGDCAVQQTWKLSAESNIFLNPSVGSTSNASGELATWFDSQNQSLYSAYTLSPGTEISITKTKLNAAGGVQSQEAFSISTEDPLLPSPQNQSHSISDLSIIGYFDDLGRGHLYLSYLMNKPLSPGYEKSLRLRRIDISEDGLLGFGYSGVVINNIASGANICFAASYDSATNLSKINITDKCASGDQLELNGVLFTLVDSEATAPHGHAVEISDYTDKSVVANALLAAINNLSDPRLMKQGDIASVTDPASDGNTYLNINHAHLFRDTVRIDRISEKLGAIMLGEGIGGKRVFIPALDIPTNNKPIIYSFLAGMPLSHQASSSFQQPSGTRESLELVNAYQSSDNSIYLGVRTKSPHEIEVYKVPTNNISASPQKIENLFQDNIEKIRISSPKTNNPHLYLIGQSSAAPHKLSLARIPQTEFSPSSSSCSSNCKILSPLVENPYPYLSAFSHLTRNLFDYQILTSDQSEEAILAVIPLKTGDKKPYIGKIWQSSPVVSFTKSPILPFQNSSTPPLAQEVKTQEGFKFHLSELTGELTRGDSGSVSQQNKSNGLFFTYFKNTYHLGPESALIPVKSQNAMTPVDVHEENGWMPPYIK